MVLLSPHQGLATDLFAHIKGPADPSARIERVATGLPAHAGGAAVAGHGLLD